MQDSPFMQQYEELPNSLPVFPLSSAVLLPGGQLPLNIFEPRYLNMVRDAMKSDQLIGMIQPQDEQSPPTLHRVGCAGRITQYEETRDGRFGITLSGLCRFEIREELSTTRGYRMVVPDWSKFEQDCLEPSTPDTQTALLFTGALRRYFTHHDIDADWDVIERISLADLANNLLSQLPLTASDKQILLEAENFSSRLVAFTAVLEGNSGKSATRH